MPGDSHPYMVLDGICDNHCDTKAQNAMSNVQRVDIPAAQETTCRPLALNLLYLLQDAERSSTEERPSRGDAMFGADTKGNATLLRVASSGVNDGAARYGSRLFLMPSSAQSAGSSIVSGIGYPAGAPPRIGVPFFVSEAEAIASHSYNRCRANRRPSAFLAMEQGLVLKR